VAFLVDILPPLSAACQFHPFNPPPRRLTATIAALHNNSFHKSAEAKPQNSSRDIRHEFHQFLRNVYSGVVSLHHNHLSRQIFFQSNAKLR
jgi:hypothetical protein